jgi:hypothetical protein
MEEYKTPSEAVFDEIKSTCLNYWLSLEDQHGNYIQEKVDRILSIKNHEADVMFMLAMFHPILRNHIISKLSNRAKIYIKYYNNLNQI